MKLNFKNKSSQPFRWQKISCLLLLFFCTNISFAQTAELDTIIKKIAFKEDSVRSVFEWVANEIEYDTYRLMFADNQIKWMYSDKTLIREAISTKKGVCQHYAELFNAILRRLGYQSYVVEGYVKLERINTKMGHAWNAVKVKDKWFLYDPTWSSGYVMNKVFVKKYDDTWYKVPPEEFIRSHIPFDPVWQLLNPPLINQQIKDNNFTFRTKVPFSFEDTIAKEKPRTEEANYKSRLRRIKDNGLTNELIHSYVQNLSSTIDRMDNVTMINNSNKTLTNALSQYNNYIAGKNRRFKNPDWSDEELRSLPDSIKAKVDISLKMMNSVQTNEQEMLRYMDQNRKRIDELLSLLITETSFINRYLSTKKPLRRFVFR